jgi:hypothetical protein
LPSRHGQLERHKQSVANWSLRRNLGDGIDYGQRNYDCLGELIADTLALFEQKGGDDAFINIKYMVPTYESSVNYA